MIAALAPDPLFWKRFSRHRLAMASGALLALILALSLAAPLIGQILGLTGEIDILSRYNPPSADHPLGTDALGRDVLLRLLEGGRISLFIGLVTAISAALLGTVVGVIAGYYGGVFDAILMRLADTVLALPLLPLLIVLAAIDLTKLGLSPEQAASPETAMIRLVIILTLFGWTTAARLVRAATLSLRSADFVTAARALGVRDGAIMLRHIIPNAAAPAVVAATLSAGNVILAESALSFLGLGVQPPAPSWGNMLTGALELIWQAPLLAIWPGLMIFLTVMAFNFLGDGLQDALDPKRTLRHQCRSRAG